MVPRLIRENRFAVVDVETTGLGRQAEVVQLAVIQVDCGRPGLRASAYIRPRKTIEESAYEKHGIDWTTLQHAHYFEDIARDFLALIGNRCVMGFNVKAFDFPVLDRHFARSGCAWNPAVLDVLFWERRLVPEKGAKHSLTAALERWQVTTHGARAHDALDDVRATWNLFVRMAAERPELGEAALEEVLARRPAPPDEQLAAL